MTYHWEPYKEECYRLYVTEGRPLDEVVEFFREHHDFTPSRRGFQVQFNRWNFPRKYAPVHKNARLIERVRELWEQGVPHFEQLRILTEDEGYSITTLQLRRLRLKQGLLLREPGEPRNSKVWQQTLQQQRSGKSDEHEDEEDEGQEEEDDDQDDEEDEDSYEGHDGAGYAGRRDDDGEGNRRPGWVSEIPRIPEYLRVTDQDMTPMELAQREQRRRQLEAESYEKYMTKKRRRRIKGWSGLPADPPGPPRYPSETSLVEVKMTLQLDTVGYNTVRDIFQRICEEEGIIKKTLAGPERWEAAKDRLVRESMHLRAVMWDPENTAGKKLAIDCLACDVTKRMRVAVSRMTVTEARRVLGLNPEQGRDVRFALCKIMAEDKFMGKLEAGKEHWDELKRHWLLSCDCLARAVAAGEAMDPNHATKTKAIDVLARDAMRRWMDRSGKKAAALAAAAERRTARESERRAQREAAAAAKVAAKAKAEAAEARAAVAAVAAVAAAAAAAATVAAAAAPVATAASGDTPAPKRRRGRPPKVRPQNQPLPQQQQQQATATLAHSQARLIPADLEPAASSTDTLPMDPLLTSFETATRNLFADDQYIQGYAAAQRMQAQPTATSGFSVSAPSPSSCLAVYLRLHPSSAVLVSAGAAGAGSSAPATWISMLEARTMEALRSAAAAKYPGLQCTAMQGIVKDGKGGELPLPVSDDEELLAYLQHVEGSGAPTFVLQLVQAS